MPSSPAWPSTPRATHRLGRGRGYYDRFLAQAADVYKVGLCFPFQLVEAVPCEATDVAMDRVECGPVQS